MTGPVPNAQMSVPALTGTPGSHPASAAVLGSAMLTAPMGVRQALHQ